MLRLCVLTHANACVSFGTQVHNYICLLSLNTTNTNIRCLRLFIVSAGKVIGNNKGKHRSHCFNVSVTVLFSFDFFSLVSTCMCINDTNAFRSHATE